MSHRQSYGSARRSHVRLFDSSVLLHCNCMIVRKTVLATVVHHSLHRSNGSLHLIVTQDKHERNIVASSSAWSVRNLPGKSPQAGGNGPRQHGIHFATPSEITRLTVSVTSPAPDPHRDTFRAYSRRSWCPAARYGGYVIFSISVPEEEVDGAVKLAKSLHSSAEITYQVKGTLKIKIGAELNLSAVFKVRSCLVVSGWRSASPLPSALPSGGSPLLVPLLLGGCSDFYGWRSLTRPSTLCRPWRTPKQRAFMSSTGLFSTPPLRCASVANQHRRCLVPSFQYFCWQATPSRMASLREMHLMG